MREKLRYELHLTPWQRRITVGLCVMVTGQLYFSAWAEGFRISTSVVIYPLLLLTLMRESHHPDTGVVTGCCVAVFRVALDLLQGMELGAALLLELPGALFYFLYEGILCVLVRDRRTVSGQRLWCSLILCDFGANLLNLGLSSRMQFYSEEFVTLAGVALGRASLVWLIFVLGQGYRALLLRQEHEDRYRRLFLMTAELKSELYFLRKNAEDIEAVMSNAYRLYESLPEDEEACRVLALSVARDVHEVKKDSLRIARGLEHVVTEFYDRESMALGDLMDILQRSTRQLLGQQRADIRLECRGERNLMIREHYQILSVVKNLVTNAVEAIQSADGRGIVTVESRVEDGTLILTVQDDGPGISPRGMKHLFQVGYSTKFDPGTGNINRGVGLPAVQHIVESLEGEMEVTSEVGKGTRFCVSLPLRSITGGEV